MISDCDLKESTVKHWTLAIVALGLVPAFLAPAQVPAGMSGTWKLTASFGAGGRQEQMEMLMLLRLNGNEIAGSLGPTEENQPLVIAEGKIDGENVIFYMKSPKVILRVRFQLHDGKAEGDFRTENDGGVTIEGKGSGEVHADQMTFQWTTSHNGQSIQGNLAFKKVK